MFPRKRTGYGGTRFLFRKKESCKEKPFDVRILLSLFAFARGVTGWCFWGLFIFYVLAALVFAYPVMSQRLFFALIDCSHLAAFLLLDAARRELFLACIAICTRAVFAAPAAHWLVRAARVLLIRLLVIILSLLHALNRLARVRFHLLRHCPRGLLFGSGYLGLFVWGGIFYEYTCLR